jgi:hypothetical protein
MILMQSQEQSVSILHEWSMGKVSSSHCSCVYKLELGWGMKNCNTNVLHWIKKLALIKWRRQM